MKLFQLPIALFLCSLLFVQLRVKGQAEGELDAEDGLGGEGLPESTMPDEGGLDGEKTSDFYRAGVEATDSEQELTDNNTNSELSLASSTPATPESVWMMQCCSSVAEESIAQLEKMDANYQIFTAVISRYSYLPKSLKTLAEHICDIPTPAYVNFPSTEEINDLILRGAEFKSSCQDHILLNDCTLHYQLVQQTKAAVQASVANNLKFQSLMTSSNSDQYQFKSDMNAMLRDLMMEANKKNIFANSTVIDVSSPQVGVQPLSKVSDLQKQVEEVKTVMSDNMIRILERGDRLENIDHRTEALHASSQNFKTTARRVQRNMCWKNLKWTIILGVFLTILPQVEVERASAFE
uniref:V-SNARE coiled-coil homology domain-containing protein n=1 Tax=Ditylenchus dipsaci TaxID=166011 RepID=A0A915ECY2_9BILA